MDDKHFFAGSSSMANWSQRIHDMMDEMLQRNFLEFRTPGAWPPPCNVYDSPDEFHICVELAGVLRDSIVVDCPEAQRIVIAGKRQDPRVAGQREPLTVYSLEIAEGQFRRQIELPTPISADRVESTYDKGYLWIRLPKNRKR